jgi:hypothetical protein
VPVDCRDVGGDGLRTGGARALRPLRSYRAGAPGGGWDSRPGSLRAYLVAGWVRAPPRRPPGSRKKRRPSARIGFVAAMMSLSFIVRSTDRGGNFNLRPGRLDRQIDRLVVNPWDENTTTMRALPVLRGSARLPPEALS